MSYGRTFAFFAASLLSACAGVGVVASSDPDVKLNDASHLYRVQNRPFIADRLIREAMALYKQHDNAHDLGNAYREYADFLRSASVSLQWQNYQKTGFFDPSVTFDNRMAKSTEYYRKALEHYERGAKQRRDANQFDKLTNVYYNMAYTHLKLDDRAKACADYDLTVEAYRENMARNPGAKPIAGPGAATVAELVAKEKQRAGCQSP